MRGEHGLLVLKALKTSLEGTLMRELVLRD